MASGSGDEEARPLVASPTDEEDVERPRAPARHFRRYVHDVVVALLLVPLVIANIQYSDPTLPWPWEVHRTPRRTLVRSPPPA